MVKFLRRSHDRYSKLGKRRKKKQVWRKPTGRDNKMREKRRGYPPIVSIGYSSKKEELGKLKGKNPILVKNIKDLEKIGKEDIVVLAALGKKKKLEIAKAAKEKKIDIANLNPEKFVKKNEKKTKKPEKKVEDGKSK